MMKKNFSILSAILLFSISVFAQSFNVKASGVQTFSFKDDKGRNQATFFSTTPFEDFTGLTNDISGKVSFDVKDVKSTLKGKISIATATINTGIKKRDQHLVSSEWLDAEKYPEISFKIVKVDSIQKIADNKLKLKIEGNFTCHGVTKLIPIHATIIYLDENQETLKREPGDLLGVQAEFKVKIADYGMDSIMLGKRVANIVDVKVNIVGTNKF